MSKEELIQNLFSYWKEIGLYHHMSTQVREELTEKYFDHSPSLMIVAPNGTIYEYILKHDEQHLVGYQTFCLFLMLSKMHFILRGKWQNYDCPHSHKE